MSASKRRGLTRRGLRGEPLISPNVQHWVGWLRTHLSWHDETLNERWRWIWFVFAPVFALHGSEFSLRANVPAPPTASAARCCLHSRPARSSSPCVGLALNGPGV